MKVAFRVCCARRQLLCAEKAEVEDDGRRGEEERRLAVVGVGSFPILAVLFFYSFWLIIYIKVRSIGKDWRAAVSSLFLVSMSHVVILLVLVSQNFRPACRTVVAAQRGAYR